MSLDEKASLTGVGRHSVRRILGAGLRWLLCLGSFALVHPMWLVRSQESNTVTAPAAQAIADQGSIAPVSSDASYRIGVDDVLDIRVFNLPQLSREAVRVDGRGIITMPLIGELKGACKTERQLATEIATRYLEYVRNPQVDVFIKEYKSKPVAVIGAVNSPGQFQLQRRVRLLELLTFAGGPQERAGTVVQVIHVTNQSICESPRATDANVALTDEESAVEQYDLKAMRSGNPEANPFARPGDIVTVPEAYQVYVVGNVLRPSAIPLKDTVTVSQAIAMAGGLMPDTKTENVRLIRRAAGSGEKTEIHIDLRAIEKKEAADIAVQANDIIDVPVSGSKRFLRSLMSTVAPTISQLPVRVIP